MLKVVKRAELSSPQQLKLRMGAIGLALLFTALFLALAGYNPLNVYIKILEGAFTSAHRFRQTVNKAVPLALLSLGVAVAFKMKFWNIGAEGQLYMGAFGAAYVALNFGNLPSAVLLPLMAVVGAVCGGLWSTIPALLKLKFGTSETLVTLMLNYIAVMWISYLQYGPWKDPAAIGFPKIASFSKNAVLPAVFGLHIGFIIAIAAAVFVHLLLAKSKLGYEISVLGESQTTAEYAGINIAKTTLIAIFISGALCGITGMVQASGVEKTLNDQLSGGLGFTAVITTWLAKLSAANIIVVSFLFAALLQGGVYLQTALGIPSSVAEVIQAIIIFFVLGSEFFIGYRIVATPKSKEAK